MLVRSLLACLTALLIGAEAASATERFVGPGGGGAACTELQPCEIEFAIESVAVDGDEIVLANGTYALGSSTTLNVADAITIRPLNPGAEPVISGAASFLMIITGSATVEDVRFQHFPTLATASALWMLADGALAERVFVSASSGGVACNVARGTMRDSGCYSSGTSFAAVGSHVSSPPGVYSSNLVNVTAVSESGLGMLVRVPDPGFNAAVSVRNSIIQPAVFVQVMGTATTSTASVTLASSNFPSSSTEDGAGETVTEEGTGGNQITAPDLVHGAGFEGDFHQEEGSVTINAGASDPLLGLFDIDLEDRIMGTAVDIGADEFFEEEDPGPDPDPDPDPDTDPPETTITDQPKAKVKLKKGKKKAPYSFSFIANEPSTFRCSLDDKPLVTCTSPFGGKVKKGTHTFSVFAVDTAGNADPTPATASWKVKKKKKRR